VDGAKRDIIRKDKLSEAKPDSRYFLASSIVLPAAFSLALIGFCLAYGVIPGPELLVLCFFIYAAYNRRSRRFVKDWFPFLSLFLCYEAMYTIVPTISKVVHVAEPITIELGMFGSIPTLVLQQLCRIPFLDYLGAFFYSLHFFAPTVFAFLLWKHAPENYRRYVLALGIGTYAALITFLAYPVAPPWYGVQATRILTQLDQNLGVPFYRSIFDFVESNPFAAFPSLHAMYPMLISLYALKIKKAKALPVLLFPIGVWLSTIYLGEHYVIDVIGGAAYAICAFLLAEKIIPLIIRARTRHSAC
jgi:membrane-associated phospholipid phosphatase